MASIKFIAFAFVVVFIAVLCNSGVMAAPVSIGDIFPNFVKAIRDAFVGIIRIVQRRLGLVQS